jgi:lipopolysaccharide cholinephosphotransferase
MPDQILQLNQKQIEQLREKELELLRQFISVCDKLHLKYFVAEGTLLGAVRHRGFIPWDDDIDVGMLRSDYEFFLKQGQDYLPEGVFLQTHETDPEYMHCFAKLRNSNTTFIELSSKDLNINHGIYIDVFPFDYYPDSRLNGMIYDLKKLLIRYRVREVYYIPSDAKISFKNLIRRALKLVSRLFYPTVGYAMDKQKKLFSKVKSGKRLINNGSPWGNRERIPAEWMQSTTTVQFESIDVEAPAMYDAYLKHVYGDYMELPPEGERVPHHYLYKFDVEKSSEELCSGRAYRR